MPLPKVSSENHHVVSADEKYHLPDTNSKLWRNSTDRTYFAQPDHIKLHYDRARSMCRASGMKLHDVTSLSRRFWDFHLSPFNGRDAAAFTILTIHWNLCMGTLAPLASNRSDLQDVLKQLENFDICGELMLTEIGYGLDARNLQTTAHRQPDGSFILHTPTLAAAKSMPPSTSMSGVPKIAIVFARLIVSDHDHGVKPFLVRLTDGSAMCDGITAKLLPNRPGAKPIDHAITFFDRVRLTPEALLGDPEEADNKRLEFLLSIWRVAVGTLALSLSHVPCLDICAYIAATYSQRRRVAGAHFGQRVPIIHFKTQYQPIMNAIAHAHVFRSYADWSISCFTDPGVHDWKVNHAIACIFKTTTQVTHTLVSDIIERLGWQGLYGYNQLNELLLSLRGNSVAEGDVLTLCIRLASELFQDKYRVHESRNPQCLLAQHEASLLREAQEIMVSLNGDHRGQGFNQQLSTKCRPYIEALGQRMAFEAAMDNGTSVELIDLYESYCIKCDLAWYIEHTDKSRADYEKLETERLERVLPLLNDLLRLPDLGPAITAPIVTEERWYQFVDGLPTLASKQTRKRRFPSKL